MAFDFAELARSIAAVPGARVCLVVSREGLPLAVVPEAQEAEATAALSRLAAIGQVERGFVAMGMEMWVFCRRGPFGALVIAEPDARPGVILTQLEQVLLAADENRVRDREELRSGAGRPGPGTEPLQASRFRAALHRTPPQPAPPSQPRSPQPSEEPAEAVSGVPAGTARPRPKGDREDDWVVDAVEIAREFGALYGESDAPEPAT